MRRALLIVGLGVLLGGLVVWLVMSQAPPMNNETPVDGIRRPQIPQPVR